MEMQCFYPDSSATEHSDAFGLNGQVEHKLAFIRTHVPEGTNLILVGHSIGCYIILEMMKRSPELKVCMLANAGYYLFVLQAGMQSRPKLIQFSVFRCSISNFT